MCVEVARVLLCWGDLLSRKLNVARFVACVMLITFLATIRLSQGQEQSITCWILTDPVDVDGKWTNPQEWSDASESLMVAQLGNGTAYVRTKHDADYLYVLVDYVSDTVLGAGDYCTIRFDAKGDGGNAPREDDYSFVLEWLTAASSSFWMRQGTGVSWGGLTGPVGGATVKSDCKPSADPYFAAAHMVYEFKIPLAIFASSMNSAICVDVQDRYPSGITMLWPTTYNTERPSTWGKLTISAVPIPEFNSVGIVAGIGIMSTMSLLVLNKKRLRKA